MKFSLYNVKNYVYGRGHRHGYQPIRLAFGRSESLDLLFHALQSGIMLVGRVGAFHIKNSIVRAKAGEGVDMAIGVVTCSLITGLAVSYFSSGSAQASEELRPIVSQLNEVQQLVDEKFVGEYDMDEVEDYVLTGYVSGLGDRWSYYMTEEAYEEYQTSNKDTRVGIGITVTMVKQADVLSGLGRCCRVVCRRGRSRSGLSAAAACGKYSQSHNQCKDN